MRNYDRINVLPPRNIEKKRAHIIGGGIAGLAAAPFLVDDAHMLGHRVIVYESLDVLGAAVDAGATTPPQTLRAAAAQLVEERLQ